MAKGDTKHSRARRGGYGRYYHYDDEGRGDSKWLYDEFEAYFARSEYSEDWLMGTKVAGVDPVLHHLFTDSQINRFFSRERQSLMDFGLYDGRVHCYVQNMRPRYNVHDWAWEKFTDSDDNDGRVRRLVVKKLGLEVWRKFQARALDVHENIDEKRKAEQTERADKDAEAQSVFVAERIKRDQDVVRAVKKDTELIAGAIRSEFNQAFSIKETYQQKEGDWLDDPVEGVRTGYGFGEEVRRPSGIKLQVTVSLDLSNSMDHNLVSGVASEAFRDIYLALEQLKEEHLDDLFICAFTFANDGYQDKDRGRVAYNLSTQKKWDPDKRGWVVSAKKSSDRSLGAVSSTYYFTGEDTWFYPLFEEIEKWENNHSEPGSVKLDIIITDAVIEHPSDIRRSDVIQDRRDGNLQTVMLNFLPDDEWVNSDLPIRSVQYEATKDNIAGMLRNILTEFVSVYL